MKGALEGKMTYFIAIGGHTGTGKTTLAYALREKGVVFADCFIIEEDEMRRIQLGLVLKDVLVDADYDDAITCAVRAKMDGLICDILGKGRSVIDASGFFTEKGREHAELLAKDCAVMFVGFWLTVSRDVMEQRIQKRSVERRSGSALSVEKGHASDAGVGVLDKYGDLGVPSSNVWHVIDANATLVDVVGQINRIITFAAAG